MSMSINAGRISNRSTQNTRPSAEEKSAARMCCTAFRSHVERFGEDVTNITDRWLDEYPYSLPLSSYLVLLLAEPFGIKQEDILVHAGVATMCMDSAAHIVDDISDDDGSDNALKTHVSSLLLASAMKLCVQLSRNPAWVMENALRYIQASSEAERYLWRHHNSSRKYDASDFTMIGQRASIQNICAVIYADVADEHGLLRELEQSLASVYIAVQLIDDLMDWRQDFKAGICTYPLQLACSQSRELDEMRLGGILASKKVMDKVLGLTRGHLQSALDPLTACGAHALAEIVVDTIGSLDDLIRHINVDELTRSPQTIIQDPAVIVRKYVAPRLQH